MVHPVFYLQVPIFQKVVEIVLVLFKLNRNGSVVDLVGALVFLVVHDFFFVRDKAIEGDTRGTLFHAPHRMPKVGSDDGVGIVPTVLGSRRVVLLLFENDAQGACVLEGPLVFVLVTSASGANCRGADASSGGCLALVVMGMMTLYRCRLVVVGATKRADIL